MNATQSSVCHLPCLCMCVAYMKGLSWACHVTRTLLRLAAARARLDSTSDVKANGCCCVAHISCVACSAWVPTAWGVSMPPRPGTAPELGPPPCELVLVVEGDEKPSWVFWPNTLSKFGPLRSSEKRSIS